MVLRMLSFTLEFCSDFCRQLRAACAAVLHPTARQLWQLYSEETVPQKAWTGTSCVYTLAPSLFYRLRRMGYLCARRQRLTNVELGSRALQGLLNHPYAGVRAPEYAPHGPFNLL